ncbi:Sentrin-specific protease 7 [Dissostichus eleginoides]|uniref:Sentrin-specific protease 7 n=1 Tax=Dissostichus eleginoides TaxID=100907 RepID=A0AAD9B420_DISEL|nr:Sentrin-specific protease 7 [Dissostichus eleginoides]
MASPFKIPKKKQGSDSAPLFASPLSRLQSPAPFKGYGGPSRGSADRVHAGSSSANSEPLFTSVVKTLLGLNSTISGANHRGASANHRGGGSSQSEPSSAFGPNGMWRPKRASDRLLSPPQKKNGHLTGSSSESVSVEAPDSLAELRGDGHAGSWSSVRLREEEGDAFQSDTGSSPEPSNQQQKKSSSPSYGDDFLSLPRATPPLMSSRTTNYCDVIENSCDVIENYCDVIQNYCDVINNSCDVTESYCDVIEADAQQETEAGTDRAALRAALEFGASPPSFVQLRFSSLHAGLMNADANGELMITEHGISIPLKGVSRCVFWCSRSNQVCVLVLQESNQVCVLVLKEQAGESEGASEQVEVSVVASQLRGYGLWDGGVAQGGSLLAERIGPAPSLLFLWVTDAQASVLERELSIITTSSGPVCCFLILVLEDQLQELQAALLASILDMTEYQRNCSSPPLEWTNGLLLLHSAPPPLDQHLLGLLGHSGKNHLRKSNLTPPGLLLPTRLIQYPAPPSKGRISVTKEDLFRLRDGEFLNDVIIDFYLKYLILEGGARPAIGLSRRRAAGEEDAFIPDRDRRHQRVKTWTRHVDIFSKDFLFVPVNQEAHWFLVVVCFPGLEEPQHQEFTCAAAAGKPSSNDLRPQSEAPECTEQSWRRDTVLKRPCILVMDSLKLSHKETVEWGVRRGTARVFSGESIRSSGCRVPQQNNCSDCGVYLLQYMESFLQNPVVHFDLPLRLENWFPRQRVRQKREEIRGLILDLHRAQKHT